MPHYCPKKEQRIYDVQICKKLCPNKWEGRIKLASNGFIFCAYKSSLEKKVHARKVNLQSSINNHQSKKGAQCTSRE